MRRKGTCHKRELNSGPPLFFSLHNLMPGSGLRNFYDCAVSAFISLLSQSFPFRRGAVLLPQMIS